MTNEIKWSIDQAHSEISFKVKHLMIANIKGAFKKFDASIYTVGKDFKTAEIDLSIDASSINTGEAKRDEHLKSVDFLDSKKYKQLTFTSSTIGEAGAGGNHELWGELTIKGITKPVKLLVEFGGILKDPWRSERAGFTITGKINRNDWGLVWNTALEAGGVMLSEEITISCEIELTNADQKDSKLELESATNKKTVSNN